MAKPNLKPGDIFFIDSNKTGPRIVKFLMSSPTLWHWLLGKTLLLFGKDEFVEEKLISPVRMYHAGIVMNSQYIIEQQWRVQIKKSVDKVLKKNHVIWRKKGLSDRQRRKIVGVAKTRLGHVYDIALIFGKTLTWLTGIPFFVNLIQHPKLDICVTYVAWAYEKAIGYRWGNYNWHRITTDLIDDYNIGHPKEWKLVSSK